MLVFKNKRACHISKNNFKIIKTKYGGYMMHLYDKLEERMRELKKTIKEKEKSLRKAPQGIVNVHSSKGRVQYYYKENPSDKSRKYIKENEKLLVKELCQKDYDEKVLHSAKTELKILEKLQKIYRSKVCEEVFETLNEHRQKFVAPLRVPDKELIERWENESYERPGFEKDYPEYYTDKEERVRSKSEVLIANALKNHGIPYKYECPLVLNNGFTYHPDFKILKMKNRKIIYWEHFGKMDDPEYVDKVVRKLSAYAQNGIFPGKNLIVTFENGKRPLNLKTINLMIEQYLS